MVTKRGFKVAKSVRSAILLGWFSHFSGIVHAAPQDHFGGSYELAAAEVTRHFSCDNIKDNSHTGHWTCDTKINVGQGMGLIDLRVQVRHRAPPFSGGVEKYIFETPRTRLIRDTSFRGIIGLAQFFGADIADGLSTGENFQNYLRGQDVYEVQDLVFEVSETSSSFKLTVQRLNGEHTYVSSVSDREPDHKSCTQTDGLPGWHISWSDRHMFIEPAFKAVSPEYKMIAGSFHIGRDTVSPSFRPAFGRVYDGNYITILADNVPIYQSQWIEKREPTCCTLSVQDPMPREFLFAMAQATEGIALLSHDAEGKRIIAASRFDLTNIGKAADKAIGGKFERGGAKRAGRCKG